MSHPLTDCWTTTILRLWASLLARSLVHNPGSQAAGTARLRQPKVRRRLLWSASGDSGLSEVTLATVCRRASGEMYIVLTEVLDRTEISHTIGLGEWHTEHPWTYLCWRKMCAIWMCVTYILSAAVLYECVMTITKIHPHTQLLERASKCVTKFLSSRNLNLKYMGELNKRQSASVAKSSHARVSVSGWYDLIILLFISHNSLFGICGYVHCFHIITSHLNE